MRRLPPVAAGAVALAALPSSASAHLVGIEFGGFYAGALHLVTAPGHIAILTGLGIAAAFQPRERARWTLALLPLGLLVGAMIGARAGDAAGVDPFVALLLVAAGLTAVAAVRLPTLWLGILAGFVGLVIGVDNGLAARAPDGGRGVPLWLYVPGVTVAGTMVGTFAVAGMTALQPLRPWVPLAQRVLGSWLAAIGLIFLGLTAAT